MAYILDVPVMSEITALVLKENAVAFAKIKAALAEVRLIKLTTTRLTVTPLSQTDIEALILSLHDDLVLLGEAA